MPSSVGVFYTSIRITWSSRKGRRCTSSMIVESFLNLEGDRRGAFVKNGILYVPEDISKAEQISSGGEKRTFGQW